MSNLIPIQFNNQRIMTTKILAEQFGSVEKNILDNFSNNKGRFVEGKHFYKLDGQALKDFKNSLPDIIGEPLKFAPSLILWTERGAARHAKILETDEAWEVYEELEETYFRVKENASLKLPSNYKEALLQLVQAEEEKEVLVLENKQKNQLIGELKPRADYTDNILKNTGLVTITQIAKDYGMSGTKMNELLHDLGIQYKQSEQWLLYTKHHDKGYTHSETIPITRRDGRKDISMLTKWTQKGRLFLYQLLKANDVLPTIEIKEAV